MTGNQTMVIVFNGENYVRHIISQHINEFLKDYDYQVSKKGYYSGRDSAGMPMTIDPKQVIKDGMSAW